MSARPVLIDCDPGIDDAIALLLALAVPDEIELLAVTTVAGNKPLPVTTANARRVLDLLPCFGIAVAPGCAHPLMRRTVSDSDFHGTDGLGDIGLPPPSQAPDGRHAIDVLIESVLERPPRSVTLCALGPLTNVALAFAREPSLAERLDRLLIMGGAIRDRSAAQERAEFNFRSDPQAAHMVLTSGAPIELFGLNATRQAPIARRVKTALTRTQDAAAHALERLLDGIAASDECLHDAYVVARLIAPTLFEIQAMAVEVEWRDRDTAGCCRATGGDNDGMIEVVTRIDAQGVTRLLVERLSGIAARGAK